MRKITTIIAILIFSLLLTSCTSEKYEIERRIKSDYPDSEITELYANEEESGTSYFAVFKHDGMFDYAVLYDGKIGYYGVMNSLKQRVDYLKSINDPSVSKAAKEYVDYFSDVGGAMSWFTAQYEAGILGYTCERIK